MPGLYDVLGPLTSTIYLKSNHVCQGDFTCFPTDNELVSYLRFYFSIQTSWVESVILARQYLLTLSHKSVSEIVRASHCSTDRLLDPVLGSGSDLQELFKIFFYWSQFCWSGCCAVPIFNTKTKTWHSNRWGTLFISPVGSAEESTPVKVLDMNLEMKLSYLDVIVQSC